MDFLKKHYEKILLGLVLVGLLVAIGFLPFKVSSEKTTLQEMSQGLLQPKVQAISNLDLTVTLETLKRFSTPATINLGEPNKLFNPMPWQKRPDNSLIPGSKVGPLAVVVTNITPLYMILSLDAVTVSDSGPKYTIGVERQAAANVNQRGKRGKYCKLNEKTDIFQLVDVTGKPDDPTKVTVVLNDTGERAVITKEVPFRRVEGYMADIRYDPEKKFWPNRRVNSQPPLSFNGEEYNVVAINKNEVVLSAKSNQKKSTVKLNSPSAS